MNTLGQDTITVEKAAQNLAAFAIDRTDLKNLMAALPDKHDLNLTTLEYELGILKILSVGWGDLFFMAATDNNKSLLSESFWETIQQISLNISTLTQTTTGKQIDYFNILKKRLDIYFKQIASNKDKNTDPTAIMGPMFAFNCGCPENAIAILIGTKMFTLTLGAVKEYLAAIKIQNVRLN